MIVYTPFHEYSPCSAWTKHSKEMFAVVVMWFKNLHLIRLNIVLFNNYS